MRRCILTLIAFICLKDIASLFLQDFPICIFWTKAIFFKSLVHCHCLLCFDQIIAANGLKHMIYFSSITIILSLFHNEVRDKGGKCPKIRMENVHKKGAAGVTWLCSRSNSGPSLTCRHHHHHEIWHIKFQMQGCVWLCLMSNSGGPSSTLVIGSCLTTHPIESTVNS